MYNYNMDFISVILSKIMPLSSYIMIYTGMDSYNHGYIIMYILFLQDRKNLVIFFLMSQFDI